MPNLGELFGDSPLDVPPLAERRPRHAARLRLAWSRMAARRLGAWRAQTMRVTRLRANGR